MKKHELIENLQKNKNIILKALHQFSESQLNENMGGKWTNAGHIQHLINSIKPLNQLFLLPKFVLRFVAGKPNRKSRSYDELVAKYLEKLAKSNPKVNRFGPKPNKYFNKIDLEKNFEKEYNKLSENIANKWNEETLEKYLIPHPLLGKLTVREMMMFTIYHTEHHFKALN